MAKDRTRIQENDHLNIRSTGESDTGSAGSTVEVLYQKMGDRWFAFSLIDDEVFVGSITQAEIDHDKPKSLQSRRSRAGSA